MDLMKRRLLQDDQIIGDPSIYVSYPDYLLLKPVHNSRLYHNRPIFSNCKKRGHMENKRWTRFRNQNKDQKGIVSKSRKNGHDSDDMFGSGSHVYHISVNGNVKKTGNSWKIDSGPTSYMLFNKKIIYDFKEVVL